MTDETSLAFSAETRLATYGSLAPGRVNAHQLDGLRGTWQIGVVQGRLIEFGWGADLGYPGLIIDPAGDPIEVHIFESMDLPAHWARLDAFEGANYQRTICTAQSHAGALDVMLYAVKS